MTALGLSREQIKNTIIEMLVPLGVSRIALFGSFARRESNEMSDIDILVTLPDPRKRKPIGMRWFILDQELERALGQPVDLVSEASLSPQMLSLIEKDLEIIYEKAG